MKTGSAYEGKSEENGSGDTAGMENRKEEVRKRLGKKTLAI